MSSYKTNIEEIISKVVSGQATEEERDYLLQLIKNETEVKELYLKLKNLWDISHPSFSDETIDVQQAEKTVFKQIKKTWTLSKTYSLLRNIAAILTIPLLISTSLFYVKNLEDKNSSAATQEVFAPYGTYSLITLPDNSKVWLNSGTSLRYPVQFTEDKREVKLNGEAYFEVESDPMNPFIVCTKEIKIKAIGTSFNVESHATDSITAITMVNGKVNVLLKNDYMTSLSSSDRLSFNHLSKKHSLEKNTSNKWYAWKDGKMIFRDDPLEHVFKRIGQTYNINIRVTDSEIAKHPYRATFEDESLDEILKLLEITAPIQYIDSRESDKNGSNEYKQRQIEVHRVR